jgi:hypothetical protein
VSTLRLGGRTAQRLAVGQPPEVAFRYFAGNEELLRSFLGEDRVAYQGDGVYHVRLNPHGALGLTLQPTFDVQFVEFPPDRVEMRSLRAALAETTHVDAGFDARFTGEARFEPAPAGCTLVCWAEMQVELVLPAVLAWMPTAPLEVLGNGIIHAAMNGLAGTLGPVLNRGLSRWVAQQVREATP